MDAVDALLQGPRAKRAFVMRSSLEPPWCLRIEDRAPLTITAIVHGTAWACSDDQPDTPIHLEPGDVLLCRGPVPYQMSDEPDRSPQVIIGPGQRCTTADGGDLFGDLHHAVRSWGNARSGSTVVVTGTYQVAAQVTERLLDALATLSVVRHETWRNPAVELLAAEAVKDQPGQAAILDRILDVLCLMTVRACLARPEANAPGWYRAVTDPVIGPALDLIHNNPRRAWTVASLGAEVGASRAAFARRFTEAVGTPPRTYLTRWRLDLAADHLHDTAMSITDIADAVGYESPYAFSNAFKRHTGLSPTHFRNQVCRG